MMKVLTAWIYLRLKVFIYKLNLDTKNTSVLNSGGSVWALSWCPMQVIENTQILAVGGLQGNTEDQQLRIGKRQTDVKGHIQIWSVKQ